MGVQFSTGFGFVDHGEEIILRGFPIDLVASADDEAGLPVKSGFNFADFAANVVGSASDQCFDGVDITVHGEFPVQQSADLF